MSEQFSYFDKLKNELQNFKYIGRDPEYLEYEYKGWGIGFSGWIKNYIIDYSEEYKQKKNRIYSLLDSLGLSTNGPLVEEFSVTINLPLQDNREVFRVRAVNLTNLDNKTIDEKENSERSYIQFTNGRKGGFYKVGDRHDMTLLEGYSEITNESGFAEKSTAELDTFLRLIKFIDELEGK